MQEPLCTSLYKGALMEEPLLYLGASAVGASNAAAFNVAGSKVGHLM